MGKLFPAFCKSNQLVYDILFLFLLGQSESNHLFHSHQNQIRVPEIVM